MDRGKLIEELRTTARAIPDTAALVPDPAGLRALLTEAADALATEDSNTIGCAECEVGRWVYNRIERLMDAEANTQESAELDYLARIASDVEEYGADGTEGQASEFPPPPDLRPIEAVAPTREEETISKAAFKPYAMVVANLAITLPAADDEPDRARQALNDFIRAAREAIAEAARIETERSHPTGDA